VDIKRHLFVRPAVVFRTFKNVAEQGMSELPENIKFS